MTACGLDATLRDLPARSPNLGSVAPKPLSSRPRGPIEQDRGHESDAEPASSGRDRREHGSMMEQAPKRDEIHPIVHLAHVALQRRDISLLERGLSRMFDSPDLRFAVASLVSLAAHLDRAKRRSEAGLILSVAATSVPALLQLGRASAVKAHDVARTAETRFKRFEGGTIAPRAPMFGRGAGSGAIALKDLMPPKRRID